MNQKKAEPEEMESSSGEEEEDEEDDDEGDETASESSSEEDEFDPADDRVNIIPGEKAEETPFEAPKTSAQDESSSESDEEEDTMNLDTKLHSVASQPDTPVNIRDFDSDVESEYETETESGSESEGATQEPANPTKGTVAEDEVAQKGKNKAVKQQQKDPPPSRSGKKEVLKNAQDESHSARKGHGGVSKEIASDDSVRVDKKSGQSSKKRKPESLQYDAEKDSADSGLISKKRKDADIANTGKKGAAKDKELHSPDSTSTEDPFSSKKGAERDKPAHSLGDAAKEIAKKTLHNSNARVNGSKGVLDRKVYTSGHESKQDKTENRSAVNQPTPSTKQKKLPHVWSVDEEIVMALEVLNRVKMGFEVPSKRNDDFWLSLSGILQEKLGIEFSKDQLSDKARRMKLKFQGTVRKVEDACESNKPYKHKNSGEQRLFDLLSQVWGRAQVTSLEDQPGGGDGDRKDPSKSLESPEREGKGANVSSPKARSSSKANASNDVGAKANGVVATSGKDGQAAKEDERKFALHARGPASPASDVDRLLEDKIQATLHELQEWSKRNVEEWMNRAFTLIEDSTKRLENQVRHTSLMGIAGGALPMRLCDSIEFQLEQGDKDYQKQWQELQIQELNVQAQRLELMRKECELKQEQLKLQLQKGQRKK